MMISVSDVISNKRETSALTPSCVYTGTRHALTWCETLGGSTPVIDITLGELKKTAFIYKWLNVRKIFESFGAGISHARDRTQRWKETPLEQRESTVSLATTTFIEDLSGPVSDFLSFVCANLRVAPSSLSKTEPYAFAVASGIIVIGVSATIRATVQEYRATDEQEKKHGLLVKLAKAVATFILGVLGVIALYYGPIYSVVSLVGVSALYTLGIYEDSCREVFPSLPSL